MTLILELPDNEEAALKAKAQARGVSAEQHAQQILNRDLDEQAQPEEHHTQSEETKRDTRPIWEVIVDNMKDVPREEFERLPKDGASEHDHYLYEYPKRNQ